MYISLSQIIQGNEGICERQKRDISADPTRTFRTVATT
jgi:hypothetical protein